MDRGGASGQASTGPIQPGSANIPGSNLAQDYQDKITADGAHANQGRGASVVQPLPAIPSIPSPPQSSPYATSQVPSASVTLGDPLLNAVKSILGASPETSAADIQGAFGVNESRAQALLDAALGRQASGTSSPYSTSSDRGRAKPAPPAPSPSSPSLEPIAPPIDPFGSAGPFGDSLDQTSPRDLEEAARTVNNANVWRSPPTPSPATPNMAGILGTLHGASALANMLPGGQVVSTAINAGGSILSQFPALAAAMGPLTAAAPYVAAATAAVAIPAAIAGAAINEAERARGIIGNLSPETAAANAEASIRSMMARLRTAERLGDEAADYTEAKSRISAAAQGVRDVVAEPILNELNAGMRLLATALENANYIAGGNTAARIAGAAGMNPLQKIEDLFVKMGWTKSPEELRKERMGTTPFGWFQAQPHLDPPYPFNNKPGGDVDGSFAPIAGLKL